MLLTRRTDRSVVAFWMACTSDKTFNKNFLSYMDIFLLVKYLATDELSENIN